jgi:hypothetical protein
MLRDSPVSSWRHCFAPPWKACLRLIGGIIAKPPPTALSEPLLGHPVHGPRAGRFGNS